MIKSIINFYNKTQTTEKYYLILISIFPISLILGNLSINLTLSLIFFIFIYDLFFIKNYLFIKDKIFKLLILFFLSLLVNLFFSLEPFISLPRVLKILEIIVLVIVLKKIVNKYQSEFESLILGFWSIIFSILVLDIIFEMIFGFNTLGFKSYYPGRIASFFGDELVVGSFFVGFCSIFFIRISEFFKKNKNVKSVFLLLFLIILSFLIGERSNFIKFFIISIFLFVFVIKINFKVKLAGTLIVFFIFSLLINFNENIKYRYYSQHIEGFINHNKNLNVDENQNIIFKTKDNLINFMKWTKYGAHYDAAYQIFLENPYFGIGIKQFRNESAKDKYRNKEYKWTDERATTHPHQIHFEFLSETGLFGYVFFLFFIVTSLYLSIKNYLIHKNLFQLVSILFVLTSLIPFLPSGSFFSTYSSAIFWINYSIMVSYIKSFKS